MPDRLQLTLGTKLERNDFSGFEVQPSARVAWTLNDRNTIWAAISRAVRSPARFDSDSTLGVVGLGNKSCDPEKVIAYELGYRVRPADRVSFSVAGF